MGVIGPIRLIAPMLDRLLRPDVLQKLVDRHFGEVAQAVGTEPHPLQFASARTQFLRRVDPQLDRADSERDGRLIERRIVLLMVFAPPAVEDVADAAAADAHPPGDRLLTEGPQGQKTFRFGDQIGMDQGAAPGEERRPERYRKRQRPGRPSSRTPRCNAGRTIADGAAKCKKKKGAGVGDKKKQAPAGGGQSTASGANRPAPQGRIILFLRPLAERELAGC